MPKPDSPMPRRSVVAAGALLAAFALVLTGCASSETPDASTAPEPEEETLQIAYMSFAVANTYDEPMLAAAQEVAAANNAEITVFDANNDPQAQFSQLQDVITSGQYDGVITQPIYGPALIEVVEQAIAAGLTVVNIDQILGDDLSTGEPQVDGLSANVTFIPTELGRKLGEQTVEACASKNLDPCNVAYMYDIKASALDVAIEQAFADAVAGSPVAIVAEGESFFNPANALTVVQDWLTANPNLDMIVASDQGLQGADQALAAANREGELVLVGFGGSAVAVEAVGSGRWFADIAQAPASEGRLGMQALIDALRGRGDAGGIDPFADFPNDGVITKDTASQFTAEWPG